MAIRPFNRVGRGTSRQRHSHSGVMERLLLDIAAGTLIVVLPELTPGKAVTGRTCHPPNKGSSHSNTCTATSDDGARRTGLVRVRLSGGLLSVEKRFDLFGVLLLSFVVAVTGGITRDLLIGAVPPAAVASWHTLAIAISGGLLTFCVYPVVQSFRRGVLFFDAIGLAVFAVTGA